MNRDESNRPREDASDTPSPGELLPCEVPLESRPLSPAAEAWRRLKKNRPAMIALWGLVAVVVMAVLAPLWPLQPPQQIFTSRQFATPTLQSFEEQTGKSINATDEGIEESFGKDLSSIDLSLVKLRYMLFGDFTVPSLCGTDKLGRDILARLFWGARVSLAVGFIAALVSLIIGVTYGSVSGYVGGWVDTIMMRVLEILYSVPFIFVVIFLLTILSDKSVRDQLEAWHIGRLTIFYLVVGAIYWLTMARVVRGMVMSLKQEQFVEAARALGATHTRIIFRHLVPNVASVVIVYLTLTIPQVMLFEAFLSFLGLGVEAPNVSWGLLANEGVQVMTEVRTYWWIVLFPGLVLGATLLALNILGDALRDALDPRLKNR